MFKEGDSSNKQKARWLLLMPILTSFTAKCQLVFVPGKHFFFEVLFQNQ